jgi:hypothetical protein
MNVRAKPMIERRAKIKIDENSAGWHAIAQSRADPEGK